MCAWQIWSNIPGVTLMELKHPASITFSEYSRDAVLCNDHPSLSIKRVRPLLWLVPGFFCQWNITFCIRCHFLYVTWQLLPLRSYSASVVPNKVLLLPSCKMHYLVYTRAFLTRSAYMTSDCCWIKMIYESAPTVPQNNKLVKEGSLKSITQKEERRP